MVQITLRDSLQQVSIDSNKSFTDLIVRRLSGTPTPVPIGTIINPRLQILDGERRVLRLHLFKMIFGIFILDLLTLVFEVVYTLVGWAKSAFDLNLFVHSVTVLHVYLLFLLLDRMMVALEKIKNTNKDLKNVAASAMTASKKDDPVSGESATNNHQFLQIPNPQFNSFSVQE